MSLRGNAVTCVLLALVAAGAEIAMALSLVPILASLGVGAGGELYEFVHSIPAFAWLVLFTLLAGLGMLANWLSAVKTEQGMQELVVYRQARLYRSLAVAH